MDQLCHSQWYQCQASSSVWSGLKRVTKGNESAWLCVFKVTEKEALNIFVSVLIPVDKGRQIVAACFISDDLCFIMNHGNNLPLFRFDYDSFPCSRSQFWLCFFQNYVCVCVCPPSCPVVFFVCFFCLHLFPIPHRWRWSQISFSLTSLSGENLIIRQ